MLTQHASGALPSLQPSPSDNSLGAFSKGGDLVLIQSSSESEAGPLLPCSQEETFAKYQENARALGLASPLPIASLLGHLHDHLAVGRLSSRTGVQPATKQVPT